jgi:hypothetical protein
MSIFYKKTLSGPNGSISKVGSDPIKKPSTSDLVAAKKYSDTHPEEMAADAQMAKESAANQFNAWADAIEQRMGNGYKMDRVAARDRFYMDPKTNTPYSIDQGYNTFNRMRAKTNYANAYKQFYTQNNLPVNGGIYRKAKAAFNRDYPVAQGQTYSEYKPLPAGKVAMYEDPDRFQKQRIDWLRHNTK